MDGNGEAKRDATADLEARLRVLSAFVGGILIEIDAECRYVGVWTGEPELLVRPAEELIGKKVAEMIGPEAGAIFEACIHRVLASGVAETVDYSLDVVAGRRAFRCLVRPTPAPWSTASRPNTVTLLVRDTTEETELKAKLVEAERRAAMGLVAASIGHEIRQPVSFATTSLEVLSQELEREGSLEPHARDRAREALAQVRDALQRIRTIAASVGVVARDRHQAGTTDVRRPALAAVDLCASQLQGRSRVTLSLDDLPRVRMNEGQLCQVLTNLLLNAAQAMGPAPAPDHRIDVRGTVVNAEGEAKVRIDVVDDGCGIDPAHLSRIFDPFFTTKEPGQGTGLGLFVSKRMIEDAGGTLEIKSTSRKGTVASMTLPIAPERAPLVCQTVPAGSGRTSLLVVDDEPAFLRSLQLVLDGSYDLVVCSKSPEALEMVRADPARFDAVLCDLSMPQIDGVAFYKQMEALGIESRFVLMTAGAFTPRAEAFVKHSRCKRLNKPFAVDELVEIIAGVTRRSPEDLRTTR